MDDIIAIYPDSTDIISGRASFDVIKRANPTAILKVWHQYIYLPYKTVIDNGDIRFFFEKDYGQDLVDLANPTEIMEIIDRIRGPIKQMDPTNQLHTAKYFQNLSKMAMLYVQL
jgi:hypothetical protein